MLSSECSGAFSDKSRGEFFIAITKYAESVKIYIAKKICILLKNDIHCESPLQIYKNKRKLPLKKCWFQAWMSDENSATELSANESLLQVCKKCYLIFGLKKFPYGS